MDTQQFVTYYVEIQAFVSNHMDTQNQVIGIHKNCNKSITWLPKNSEKELLLNSFTYF